MVPRFRLTLLALCALAHVGCADGASGGADAATASDGGALQDSGGDGEPGAGPDGGPAVADGGVEAGDATLTDTGQGGWDAGPATDGGDTPDTGAPGDSDDSNDAGGSTPDALEPLPCTVDFDCAPGQACVLAECGDAEPPCGTDEDCVEGLECTGGACVADGVSPQLGKIVVNELLTDGSADEDANGDGSIDALEDEFLELVNVGNEAVDLSGWTVVEADFDVGLPRHTFPAGTVLPPAGAIVVFGGGDAPPSTESVAYVVANAADPGISFGLDLDDGGDSVRLLDAQGLLVALAAFGDGSPVPATSDQSLTRSPDLIGGFVPHTTAPGADGAAMSPGSRLDGSPF